METRTRGKRTIDRGLRGSVGILGDMNPTRLSKWSQAVPLQELFGKISDYFLPLSLCYDLAKTPKLLFIFFSFSFLFISLDLQLQGGVRESITWLCHNVTIGVTDGHVTVTVCHMTRVTWRPWESKCIATVVKCISSREMSENSIEFSLSNSEQRDSWLNSSHWTLDADTLDLC